MSTPIHEHKERDSDDSAWYRCTPSSGIRIADTLDEVKSFAYDSFDRLDKNNDGFVSRQELNEVLHDHRWSWRDRSYVSFLLRRLDDIKAAYDEEWGDDVDGISRVDIQEYFNAIREKIPGPKR